MFLKSFIIPIIILGISMFFSVDVEAFVYYSPFTDSRINSGFTDELKNNHVTHFKNIYNKNIPFNVINYNNTVNELLTEDVVKEDEVTESENDEPETELSYEAISTFDLRTKHNLSLEEIELLLSRFPNLKSISQKIYDCQQEYDVNTYFIIALIRNESANGNSGLAKNSNNLIGARTNQGWMKFSSKNECVDYVYRLLSKNYLSEDGKFFNGYTIDGVNTKYCGDAIWRNTIISMMVDSYNKVQNNK